MSLYTVIHVELSYKLKAANKTRKIIVYIYMCESK